MGWPADFFFMRLSCKRWLMVLVEVKCVQQYFNRRFGRQWTML